MYIILCIPVVIETSVITVQDLLSPGPLSMFRVCKEGKKDELTKDIDSDNIHRK